MLFCVAVCHFALSCVGVVLRCVGLFSGSGCGCVALRLGPIGGVLCFVVWCCGMLCCLDVCVVLR